MKLAERLIELRKDKKLSQQKLANLLGVAQSAVAKWETASRQPDLDMLYKICKVLDVSSDYLLGITDL